MKRILLLIMLPHWLAAAVTGNSQWQVWTTGNDLNGGCFDSSVTNPGTNYSRQTGAQTTFNGSGVTASGSSSTLTISGYTVAASDNGNCLQITSGASFTAGFYTITSVNTGANTWTLNANPTTGSASGMVGRMGGAVATLTKPAKVAGNRVWVKATGTYSVSTAQTIMTTAGSSLAWIGHEGYTTTEGDGGQFTVARSSGSSFSMLSGSQGFNYLKNAIVDCASGTSITGLAHTGGTALFENVRVQNCTLNGISITSNGRVTLRNAYVTGQSGSQSFNITAQQITIIGCQAIGGSVTGFTLNTASSTGLSLVMRSIAAGNTGSSHGFRVAGSMTAKFFNVIAYGNGGDGLLWDTSTTSTVIDGGGVFNSIFEGNGGYGINANAANVPFLDADYNALYNNTSGARNNFPAGAHDVTLTASAFVNAGGGNFGLNNTAGGGALCRSAGWPGILQYGGTGYADIGPLQHQDSGGGGGGQKGYTWVAGVGGWGVLALCAACLWRRR